MSITVLNKKDKQGNKRVYHQLHEKDTIGLSDSHRLSVFQRLDGRKSRSAKTLPTSVVAPQKHTTAVMDPSKKKEMLMRKHKKPKSSSSSSSSSSDSGSNSSDDSSSSSSTSQETRRRRLRKREALRRKGLPTTGMESSSSSDEARIRKKAKHSCHKRAAAAMSERKLAHARKAAAAKKAAAMATVMDKRRAMSPNSASMSKSQKMAIKMSSEKVKHHREKERLLREREREKEREKLRMRDKDQRVRSRSPKMRTKSKTPPRLGGMKRRSPEMRRDLSSGRRRERSVPKKDQVVMSRQRHDSRERDRERQRERDEREAARNKEREEALARCQERQRERERIAKERSRKMERDRSEEQQRIKTDRLLPRPADRAIALAAAAGRGGRSREKSIDRPRSHTRDKDAIYDRFDHHHHHHESRRDDRGREIDTREREYLEVRRHADEREVSPYMVIESRRDDRVERERDMYIDDGRDPESERRKYYSEEHPVERRRSDASWETPHSSGHHGHHSHHHSHHHSGGGHHRERELSETATSSREIRDQPPVVLQRGERGFYERSSVALGGTEMSWGENEDPEVSREWQDNWDEPQQDNHRNWGDHTPSGGGVGNNSVGGGGGNWDNYDSGAQDDWQGHGGGNQHHQQQHSHHHHHHHGGGSISGSIHHQRVEQMNEIQTPIQQQQHHPMGGHHNLNQSHQQQVMQTPPQRQRWNEWRAPHSHGGPQHIVGTPHNIRKDHYRQQTPQQHVGGGGGFQHGNRFINRPQHHTPISSFHSQQKIVTPTHVTPLITPKQPVVPPKDVIATEVTLSIKDRLDTPLKKDAINMDETPHTITAVADGEEDNLSEISDDVDDILEQPPVESAINSGAPKLDVDLLMDASSLSQPDLKSALDETKDLEMDLDFEEISDGELEEEAARHKGLGDALGVDWKSLVEESKAIAKEKSEANKNKSVKQLWQPHQILLEVGVSFHMAGEEFGRKVLHEAALKAFEEDNKKDTKKDVKVEEEAIKDAEPTTTTAVKVETSVIKVEPSQSPIKKEQLKLEEPSTDEVKLKIKPPALDDATPAAAVLQVAQRLQVAERNSLVFNAAGPYSRALSARRDLQMRRQLCGLPAGLEVACKPPVRTVEQSVQYSKIAMQLYNKAVGTVK